MKNSKSKVAVIGLGNIGQVVATNLVKGNRSVIVADKAYSKAKNLAQTLGELATPLNVNDAIQNADIVVLAVYFDSIKQIFKEHALELKGKIIVDPSNPIGLDENGGFRKIIGRDESAGQILSSILPDGTKLAKALGTLSAASLESASFNNPQKIQFYTIDDTSIQSEIEELIKDNGFDPYYVGTIDKSIQIEVFGDLHEYGTLGKPVTRAELKTVF